MRIRIKTGRLSNGKWAAFTGRSWYTHTVADTEREARILRLQEIGREAYMKQLDVEDALRELNALDEDDPRGYLV